jgi:hypothetical protein
MPGIVHRNNIRMLKPGEETDLPKKSNLVYVRARLDMEDLDRYKPFQSEIAGQENCGERAFAELALEKVSSGERLL